MSALQAAVESGSALLWQSTLVLGIVLAADLLLARRAWPRLRMTIWTLAFARLLLPPDVTSPVALLGAPSAPSVASAAGAADAVPAAAGTWLALAIAMSWLLGAVAVGCALAVRERRARRRMLADTDATLPDWLARQCDRAAEVLGMRRVPRVVLAPAGPAAAVVGSLRTVVVVSRSALRELSREEAFHVLLHEFAHVRRRDALHRGALHVIQCAWWFHPLVWIAGRRIASLRELCCDATVADALRDATPAYRATLLRAARRLVGTPQTAPALGLLRDSCGLLQRLRHLEGAHWQRPTRRRSATLLAAGFMAACVVPAARQDATIPQVARRASDPLRVTEAQVAAARDVIGQGLRGERPGCLHIRNAALIYMQHLQDRQSADKPAREAAPR